jgi:3-isopropylmalate/(R)-2-methylmalate dehydratase large subunit
MSLVGKIFDSRIIEPAGGQYYWCRPDLVLLPEYALALHAELLTRNDLRPANPERVIVVADHFCPPATIERAEILRTATDLCRRWELPVRLFEGICHQLLIEDRRAVPGSLIVGSDSHTTTAGALGALAIGFGGTDVMVALTENRIALCKPEVIGIELIGRKPASIMGKDIILAVFQQLGPEKVNYRALEFIDHSTEGIGQDDRFSICNMVVEAGGKAALFVPDKITGDWLTARDGTAPELPEYKNEDADYIERHRIDLESLTPLVAMPHDPFNIAPVSQISGLPLDQVFIGSCSAGRITDLDEAASILKGKQVAPGLKAIIIPASKQVYLQALDSGALRVLIEAGATIGNPSCGPCGAIDKGILAAGERCAATINRNYHGRMGSPDAEIYLVNSRVAAASMVAGKLVAPEDLP